MNKLLKFSGIALLMSVSFYSLWALEGFKTLDNIAIDGSTVNMTLSGKTKYNAFKITNPPRIVIEFTNTEFNAKDREITGSGDIKRIRAGQFQNEPVKVARVVIDLVTMLEYEVKSEGNNVKLVFYPEGYERTTDASATEQPVPAAEPAQEQPAAVVALKAEAPKAEAPKAEAPKAEAPVEQPVALEETPITIAEPVAEKEASNIDITSPKAAQSPDTTSEMLKEASVKSEPALVKPQAPVVKKQKPAPRPAAPKKDVKQPQEDKVSDSGQVAFPKKPITIDFEEADIKDVFRMLSMKSGINIIYGNDVSGTITLRLENVPFDKAFATILTLKNYVSQEQGPNILRIAIPMKITEERAQAVTFTKVFALNYAKSEDVKANLDLIRSAEGRRGNISVDSRTNSLIITDTPEGLVSLEGIIKELDLKPAQVIIEAKIVEVQLTNDFDLGIQWQYANTLVNQPGNVVAIGASQSGTSNSALGADAVAGATIISPLSAAAGGTGVAFPASAVSGQIGSIAFGVVSNQTRITGMLTALAQKGLSKLLSNPKVTTVNNKEARILVGQRIPYTTTTVAVAGTTQSTQFLDVGVKLTVTPTINADRKITLAVHPEVSLFVRADAAGPVVGTREANTTVIVSDGETVVIGGLITDQDIKQGSQVPLLGDLPIIGHLFKRTLSSKSRTELLVFLTPQILDN